MSATADSQDGRHAGAMACAAAIGVLFEEAFTTLERWRVAVEEVLPLARPGDLDGLILDLVAPELVRPDPLLVGAGFIAAPGVAGNEALHFAWWLGPLRDNPLLGTTTGPSQLDLASREYADYLRDFSALEWYRVPQATHARHITGPYVDHLCTCDYILTLTQTVDSGHEMVGVVGGDVLVRSLESRVLPLLRAVETPAALISDSGRVIVSTLSGVPVGSLVRPSDGNSTSRFPCPGTRLQVLLG